VTEEQLQKEVTPVIARVAGHYARTSDERGELLAIGMEAVARKLKENPDKGAGWFITAGKWAIIDEVRDMAKRRIYQAFDNLEIGTDGGIGAVEERINVDLAMEAAGEDMVEIFMGRAAGENFGEIAERIDLPIGTVKTRIHRARKRLYALGFAA
jgi:RNA polymerase sigma-70 factor, ECF subfamily